MLPPVRATLSPFVEYQTPSQQPVPRQRIDVANGAANIETIASSPLSGGRLDILSLSTQLQLAQGFSIFAETIGKLIKLPRREGEALPDYARRLSEAVKAMNPVERAALERTLNQLVKGVSLRLLTEILNNPAGPDAARFAMRMETAQLLDRDLAAKAVVSSYRQNAGAEQMPAGPPRPANGTPSLPGQAVGNGTPPTAEATIRAVSQAGAPGATAAASQAGAIEEIAISTPANDVESLLQTTATSKPGAEDAALAAEFASPSIAAEAEGTSIPSMDKSMPQVENSPETELPAAAALEQDAATELVESEASDDIGLSADDAPEGPSSTRRFEDSVREKPHPTSNIRQTSSPVFYDGPALARLSQRGAEQQASRTMPRAALDTGRVEIGAMTEWLTEAFSEGAGEFLEPLPAAARPLLERQALKALLDGELPLEPAPQVKEEAAATLAKPAAQTAAEPETSTSAIRSAGGAANPNGQSPGATELSEQFVLPLPLPHALREGIALPYVAYPPEEREKDLEERKTKAISKTDEDGEQQHSADQQTFSEDQAPGDEKEDADERDPDEETGDAGRANDLYWRMAGWT